MCSRSARPQRPNKSRQALTDAAVALVAEHGIDALTADRIAARAGVSRRTLFNHFERVEDVLTASMEELVHETIEAVVDRPAEEPLRVALCHVLEDLADSPVFAQVQELEWAASGSPATRRFLLEFGDRQADAVAEGLRRRIGPDADPLYVTTLAAAAAAVLSGATRLAVHAPTAGEDPAARHVALIRRSFDLLFSGFDEAAATVPTTSREN